jgi:hypothetical protein
MQTMQAMRASGGAGRQWQRQHPENVKKGFDVRTGT